MAFVLEDRAVAAARQGNLPKSVLKIIYEAPRYGEETGVRFMVRGIKDLAAVRKLAPSNWQTDLPLRQCQHTAFPSRRRDSLSPVKLCPCGRFQPL